MELEKKTTILFPPDLHEHLARLARQRGVSLGELVRNACTEKYGRVTRDDRVEAAEALGGLSLPVSSVARMKRESIPAPRGLHP